jgi:hypothetical protein
MFKQLLEYGLAVMNRLDLEYIEWVVWHPAALVKQIRAEACCVSVVYGLEEALVRCRCLLRVGKGSELRWLIRLERRLKYLIRSRLEKVLI